VSRIPIRFRLTGAYAAAMAIVFAAAGFFLYQHLAASLDRTLAQDLRTRTADISALVKQADTALQSQSGRDGVAQVLRANGHIYDHTPGVGSRPLLTARQLARARQGSLLVSRVERGGKGFRLLATPVTAQGLRLVVVAAAPLETRDNALATLRTELLIGGPVGLLLASLMGYLLAAAALRPVERMRGRAAAISASRLAERLPVQPSRDEVSRLGETLNEMLARLETALQRERSFVADASHELRTPLAHLKAEIELALERPRKREELTAALRSVGSETDRLSQLATDLLLLAHVDDGTLPIRREEVALDELLTAVAARFERRAHEAGRKLEASAQGSSRIDRLRIEQALGNLVENALRYGAGTIRMSAVEVGDSLELHVTDEGAGFPPGFAAHAFERFRRADGSRTTGGAGLGLAIVAAIARAHGGTATVAPASGGADVLVRLPLTGDRKVTYAGAHGRGVQGPGRPDAAEPARRVVQG
jgi:two-component system OmpR family sensor kinase